MESEREDSFFFSMSSSDVIRCTTARRDSDSDRGRDIEMEI
jgi:hypothetical protein